MTDTGKGSKDTGVIMSANATVKNGNSDGNNVATVAASPGSPMGHHLVYKGAGPNPGLESVAKSLLAGGENTQKDNECSCNQSAFIKEQDRVRRAQLCAEGDVLQSWSASTS